MKLNLKVFIYTMAVLVLALVSWNIYLLKVNGDLQMKVNEVEENYRYLEGYNKVIEYDRTTARDSVRILENWINANEDIIVFP